MEWFQENPIPPGFGRGKKIIPGFDKGKKSHLDLKRKKFAPGFCQV